MTDIRTSTAKSTILHLRQKCKSIAVQGSCSAYLGNHLSLAVVRASYTTSLASDVTDYKFEHGRRYHAYKAGSEQAIRTVPYKL